MFDPRTWVVSFQTNLKVVMPAHAGIQVHPWFCTEGTWIPAFAGMTEGESSGVLTLVIV
jgi:hypothetical protein